MESISIIDGKHQSLSKNALPEILSDALAVNFDANIGHDYLGNFNDRYEFYHREEERVQFDLEYFNKITQDQMTAVDNDLMREQQPGMPINIERQSRVTFGGNSKK